MADEGLLNIREELEEIEAVNEVLQINENLYPQQKIYLERKNPFHEYDEKNFKKRYRMSKDTARYVIGLVRDDLLPMHGNLGKPISPEIQVLATIRYLAKGAYEQDIGM